MDDLGGVEVGHALGHLQGQLRPEAQRQGAREVPAQRMCHSETSTAVCAGISAPCALLAALLCCEELDLVAAAVNCQPDLSQPCRFA